MKLKSSTILENLIASVILMTLFIISGNALNNIFKRSIQNRNLTFNNSIKKDSYLIVNGVLETPHYLEIKNRSAEFKINNDKLLVKIEDSEQIDMIICCIKRK